LCNSPSHFSRHAKKTKKKNKKNFQNATTQKIHKNKIVRKQRESIRMVKKATTAWEKEHCSQQFASWRMSFG
jgi:hypothetical protein